MKVLSKGIFVTGGMDGKIRFWDPIGIHCMAIVSEEKPILAILGYETTICYAMSSKVVSFNYLKPKFELLFEGDEEEVTSMCDCSDLGSTTIFIGTSKGIIYFIDRKSKVVTVRKKYHEESPVRALHHSNENLISADFANKVVIFNTNSLTQVFEIDLSGSA